MKKLVIINLIIAGLLVVGSVAEVNSTRQKFIKYGWKYNETVITDGEVTQSEVDLASHISSVGMILGFAIVFISNAITLRRSLTFSIIKEDEMGGILFPHGEPKGWYAEGDLINQVVEVGLGEFSIRIPRETIDDWFKKEEAE